MLVCPSLALTFVPSDQSSPVHTFLSFAGVKHRESLEWPVAAHQNDTSWVFFWEWPSWGILIIFLSMLTWECVCWLNKMVSETSRFPNIDLLWHICTVYIITIWAIAYHVLMVLRNIALQYTNSDQRTTEKLLSTNNTFFRDEAEFDLTKSRSC